MPENNEVKKKKIWIPIVIAVASALLLALIIAIVSVSFLVFGADSRKVKKQIALGDKYLTDMDYDAAILAYEEAIKIDPKCEDAYLKIAKIYEKEEKYDEAQNILQRGKDATGSDEIATLLKHISEVIDQKEAERLALEEAEQKANDDDYASKREELIAQCGIGYDEGNVISDFTMYDKNGNPVKITDFQGKAVYINFFTTWCPYCIYEVPDMQSVKQAYGDDVVFIMIDLGETVAEAEQYAIDNGIDFEIYYLEDWYTDDMEIEAVPLSIVIDKYGYVVGNCLGQASYDWMSDSVNKAIYEER